MVRKWIKSTLCATVGAITLIFATPQQSQAQANLEIVFIDSLWGGGIGAVSGLALWAWKDQKSAEVTSMIARGTAVGVFGGSRGYTPFRMHSLRKSFRVSCNLLRMVPRVM